MITTQKNILNGIKGGLIVSCQALQGEPLYGEGIMARMAVAAKQGGAVGIRANGKEDVSQISKEVGLPVIGICKRYYNNSEVFITPTLNEVKEIVEAGATIVAFDGTGRERPDGQSLQEFISQVKAQFPNILLMADISTLQEGVTAADLGVDIVATTLSGYTPYSKKNDEPDFELIEDLYAKIKVPIIAEGRVTSPSDAIECMDKGAWSVVVGTAITRPHEITKIYVRKIDEKYGENN